MSLGNRLTLWIIALPLIVLLAVAVAALHQDTQWRKEALRERLVTAAELQAAHFGRALARDDTQQLERLAGRLLAIDEARGVGLYTQPDQPIVELGRHRSPSAPPSRDAPSLETRDDLWRLTVPLPEGAARLPGPAWLELDIDPRPLTLAFYRQLAIAGLGMLVLGLLLFVVGSSLGRRLDGRLGDFAEALHRIKSGGPHPQLSEQGPQELTRLARRINALGDALERSREHTQRQIEQTTADLQESMETIEIKNIELDLAHRRALEASRVKSEFLASMSHEIRTPLNGIVGFCRLLGRSRLEPRQREWLDQVQVACDNLLALVNDVLDFSRIEAGRMELDHTEMELVSLVDEVLSLQAPLAHQKSIELLGLVYDDVPSHLRGDPLRLRQVLTNLVHNALKFTHQGDVIVRVMVDDWPASNQVLLRLSVCDTGIGLSPQEQRDLFQAFRQATPGHSREYGGSGLGLAISRQLVEQMGGRISVESEPGRGSTFAFTLPLDAFGDTEPTAETIVDGERIALLESHAPTRFALQHLLTRWGAEVIEPASAEPLLPPPTLLIAGLPAGLTPPQLEAWQARLDAAPCPVILLVNANPLELPDLRLPSGSEILSKPVSRHTLASTLRRHATANQGAETAQRVFHVLVVDDNPSNRRLLRELLTHPALSVEEAGSGEEALALAEAECVDLVLMDIRMPGMDGVETTQALRKRGDDWARCPVIAVTAHARDDDHQRLREAGLQGVLTKPVDSDALSALLHRHLGPIALEGQESPPSSGAAPSLRNELDVVDLALGTRLANGNESLARELLDELAGSLPASRQAMEAALSTEEEEALLDAVHALNGACRYCGAPELALVAETLETRLRSRGMADIGSLMEELFAAMQRLQARWQAPSSAQPSSTTMASASSASSESDR